MEDALIRLRGLINYAVLATTGNSPDQLGALHARIACALTTQGKSNSEHTIVKLSNFEPLRETLPVLIRQDGKRRVHPIWESTSFVAAAIVSLAIVYDRQLRPGGDSILRLAVTRDGAALHGYRLTSFQVDAGQPGPDGEWISSPPTPSDWAHVSIVLAGAALGFLSELPLMRFAPYYLYATVEGRLPEGSVLPHAEGRPAPIRLE